jgi:hypothetical protein
MGVKWGAPGGTGVGEEDVDVVGGLGDLADEVLDAGELGTIGWDAVGSGSWLETWEGVQGRDGLFAGLGLAGCDVDFGAAGLEEAVIVMLAICFQ